jgi:hypothetical protein
VILNGATGDIKDVNGRKTILDVDVYIEKAFMKWENASTHMPDNPTCEIFVFM